MIGSSIRRLWRPQAVLQVPNAARERPVRHLWRRADARVSRTARTSDQARQTLSRMPHQWRAFGAPEQKNQFHTMRGDAYHF